MPDNPFYQTIAWKLLRSQALARDYYLCQRCLKKKILTNAREVHHIKPIADYPEYALALSNLVSLCTACHNKWEKRNKKKSEREEKKRKARIIKG